MKFIFKFVPPIALLKWYLHEDPMPRLWSRLPSSKEKDSRKLKAVYYYSKQELKSYLILEQNGTCGYCNRIISNDHTSPIEHINPRELYKDNIFDYFNLILSCDGGKRRPTDKELHCDALKSNNIIEVKPTIKTCEKILVYDEFGNVFSKELKGKNAIAFLGLDCSYLVNRRSEIIKEHIFDENRNYKSSREYREIFIELLKQNEFDFKFQVLCVLKNLMNLDDKRFCEKVYRKFNRKIFFRYILKNISQYPRYLYLKGKIHQRGKEDIM